MVIYAGTKGYLDDVPVDQVTRFQDEFLRYVDTTVPGLRQTLAEKKDLTDEIENQLKQALDGFKARAWKK